MDTPSPSTASTTAHAVGYNDEPSITAAPLRSTDDLAVDAGQLSSLILTTEATATPQRIVESVTSLTSSGILAEGQRMPTVRDLARLLRTSPATVSSAYHALARSGILRSRGRAGTFVLRQSRTHRYDAGDLLAEDRLRREGYLRPEPIIQTWQAHLRGEGSFGYRLWSVLMFQAWLAEQRVG